MATDARTSIEEQRKFFCETEILQELRYIEDQEGNRTAVVIPIEHWDKIKDVYVGSA